MLSLCICDMTVWIRFHTIVYRGNRLLYVCTVRGYNTGYNSGVTDVDAWLRASCFAKLNVKTGHHLACISAFSILLVFSRSLCFTIFLECFIVISFWYRIDIHIRIHFPFSFSKVLASAPPSATFLTLAEISGYVTDIQLHFPEKFGNKLYTNGHNQRRFSNFMYTAVILPRQLLIINLPTMHSTMMAQITRSYGSWEI